jgi:tetratricopeptide (TPR) repeat protein
MAGSPNKRHSYNQAMNLAHQLRRSGLYVDAAEAFLVAARCSGADRDALLYRATCLKAAGQTEAAREAYRLLLESHPSFATGWSLYGVFLKNIGDYIDAISALRTSLQLEEDVDTRNTLVVALYKSDQVQAAQAEGLQNLQLKDARSLKRFARSPSCSFRLNWIPRKFTPKNRQRNVIAYSLWGDRPGYIHGAIVNARISPHIYYGWTPRFYCDSSVPSDAIQELHRAGAQIVRIKEPELQAFRPLWRFLASDDPNVDWFLCRDADSRLNCQELIAVEEWLRSGQPFHVMRDHIYHMELMLAGMWGGAAGVLPNLRDRMLATSKYCHSRFADQAFLADEVWPLIRDHLCTHDTYYHFNDGRDFPSAYRLPRPVHVGGSIKEMPSWRN